MEESILKLRTEKSYMKKNCFAKNPAPANRIKSVFSSPNASERKSEFASIFVPRNGIPIVFSSVSWFGTEFQVFASIFVPQNGIPRVCFYFCSMVQNSEHFSPSAEWFGTEF
jgi:hypothetical protein